jgi:hypothetical protein
LRVNYGGTAVDTAIRVDYRNVVIFRPNYSSGSTIASTYTWRDGKNKLLDADVTFYTTDWTFHVGTSGCSGSRHIYIEDVTAHEFGHAIGVSHSGVAGATMYPSTTSCSKVWRTLAADDIAAARSLYGTGALWQWSDNGIGIGLGALTSGLRAALSGPEHPGSTRARD